MVMIDTNDYLSMTGFAKACGITRQGVSIAIKRGDLEFVRAGGHKLIHKDNIEKYKKK